MRTGSRWLLAGLTGALLTASVPALAQGSETPTAPVVGRASGTGPTGSFNPPAPIRSGEPISVLVFPFGYAGEVGAEAPMPADPNAPAPADGAASGLTEAQTLTANQVTAAVKAGLLSSPSFGVATYHPQSALILRGRKDDILRPEMLTDLVSPATGAVDPEKAKNVTYRLGMQAFMIGTIDVKEDPKTNTVEITLETQIINSANNQILHAAAVSGAAAGAEGVPLDQIRERAAVDAAQKALLALGIQMVSLQPNEEAKKKAAADKQAARAARKAEKEARAKARREEKARKKSENARDEKPERTRKAKNEDSEAVRLVSALGAPGAGPAPAGTPPTAGSAPAPASGPTAYTNSAGEPIPYGYALGADTEKPVTERRRRSFKFPTWLGLAGFLTGLSFLL